MIYVDVHEPQEIIEGLTSKRLTVEVKRLESGDYVFNDVAIERKTLQDLINSTFSKRLWTQLINLCNTYKQPVLLIEGWSGYSNLDVVTKGIITTVLTRFKIPILFSYNYLETVEWIKSLYIKTGTNKVTYLPAPVKKQKTIQDIKLEMLQVIPTIGPKTASVILKNNPYIFSRKQYNLNLNVKGLSNKGKQYLEELLNENEVVEN